MLIETDFSPLLKLECTADGIATISVSGHALTRETAVEYTREIASMVEGLAASCPKTLMVDIDPVGRLDAVGVQLLLSLWYAGVQADCEVCLITRCPIIRSILEKHEVHRLIRLYENAEEAARYLYRGGWID